MLNAVWFISGSQDEPEDETLLIPDLEAQKTTTNICDWKPLTMQRNHVILRLPIKMST